MKILMIIPFYYKWNTSSNVRCHYEYLKKIYNVDLYTKEDSTRANLNDYDIIMLHGSGAILNNDQLETYKGKIFGFGWSDPNLFNSIHFDQSDIYFTNDLYTYELWKDSKRCVYYQTSCNKEFHKNLNLSKTTDILVYGQGNHKFVTNRNKVINDLRDLNFHIKVFGRGWDSHKDTHSFIEGKRLIEEINKAHVLLDLSNETTAWPHRILEASACGTPVISVRRKDTEQMFKENKEILLYNSYVELLASLDFTMHNKVAMRDMGLSAQERCYKKHDISVRIQRLIKIIEEIK